MVFGVIVDAPEAINGMAHALPEWMRHPNFWWVTILSAIWTVVMWVIWRKPVEDDATVQVHAKRIVLFAKELQETEHAIMDAKELNVSYLLNHLSVVIPNKVESLLGLEARKQYVKTLDKAKESSKGNAEIMAYAALPGLIDRLWDEALRLESKRVKTQDRHTSEPPRQ